MSAGLGHPITSIWLWVAEHGPEDEGVFAVLVERMGGWMPLLGAEKQSLQWMRKFAETYQPQTGLPLRCKRFRLVEVVDELPATPTAGIPPSGTIPYPH